MSTWEASLELGRDLAAEVWKQHGRASLQPNTALKRRFALDLQDAPIPAAALAEFEHSLLQFAWGDRRLIDPRTCDERLRRARAASRRHQAQPLPGQLAFKFDL